MFPFCSFHYYECHWTGKYMKDYNMNVSFEEFHKINKQIIKVQEISVLESYQV
jgi:hypothetical protein